MTMNPDHKDDRRRYVMLCVAMCSIAYTTSYVFFRSRSLSEASSIGVEGLLYDSIHNITAAEDLTQHFLLSYFYAPINILDQAIFGAPGPLKCSLFDLS